MQYKVVYLIGAGFSAPIGIPMVSNFLEKSKDQFFDSPERYAHFEKVFEAISAMAVVKNYYNTNLMNIEEILSILEMREQFTKSKTKSQFLKYISDVIEHHTPAITEREYGSNWPSMIFGKPPWSQYGAFTAALVGQAFKLVPPTDGGNAISYKATKQPSRPAKYSIITLNYDLLFEICVDYMNSGFGTQLKFKREWDDHSDPDDVYIAKLHGSIDSKENIVPPTWNKSLNYTGIVPAWQVAYNTLAEANHIRIIGYSLPTNDSYIRYLLRSATIDSTHHHVKNIDVLCFDPDGSVKARYDEFMQFSKYRFRSALTEDYLRSYTDSISNWPELLTGNDLEAAHEKFFAALEKRLP